MSSPKMTRMFGFLPDCWSLAETIWLWAATAVAKAAFPGSAQQLPDEHPAVDSVVGATGCGSAFRLVPNRPFATTHPPTAPTVRLSKRGRYP
jgi:hypothetical protein